MQEFLQQIAMVTESHYQDDSLKATNLHHKLRMSRSTLHYKLKKHTGLSTAGYLVKFRIKKAIPILVGTSESIKVIAFQVGFKDPNYFSRVFKQETGVAPRQYRINQQNG